VADAPLVVQVAGNDPHYLAAATVLVADKCEAVELNLGCPQSCARNGHYGAYLMDDIPLVMQIVRQMKQAAPAVAILAKGTKIKRAGWTDYNSSVYFLD
jgi:tRNA-dihydrouridine synthase